MRKEKMGKKRQILPHINGWTEPISQGPYR